MRDVVAAVLVGLLAVLVVAWFASHAVRVLAREPSPQGVPGADGPTEASPVPPPAGPASRPGFLLRRDGQVWLWVGTEPVAPTAEVVRRFDQGATAWELAALYGTGAGVVTEAIVHERRRSGRR